SSSTDWACAKRNSEPKDRAARRATKERRRGSVSMVRLRSVDPEEPEKIGGGRPRDLFLRHAAQARDLGCDVRHIRRLVALASEWHGCEVRRIGLDQEPVQRNAPRHVLDVMRVLERDDA